MMIDWLYRTSLELTLLIALVLLLRPFVRRLLGAQVAYWLWSLPLLRAMLPDRPERNDSILEVVGVSSQNFQAELLPIPNVDATSIEFPFAVVWITGILLWAVMRLISSYRFRQTLLESSQIFSIPNKLLKQVTEKVHWQLKTVECLSCSSSSAPFVTGLLNPRIYLPRNFTENFSKDEQVWIIVHELTHIRRRDLWVQLAAEVFRAVFWFNPVVHFAVQVLQEDQELACDHSVLGRCDSEERYHYGKALMAGVGPHLVPSAMTFFTNNKERFTMLSKHKVSTVNSVLGFSLCAIISVFVLTKAPQSIAQRPVFDEVYDANAPVLLRGTITEIEQFEEYSLIYIDSNNVDGESESWVVEGGSVQNMEEHGLNQSVIGRSVIVRGYQSIDKSCNPYCKMNGRDLEFIDS